jgi:hypothetical protein
MIISQHLTLSPPSNCIIPLTSCKPLASPSAQSKTIETLLHNHNDEIKSKMVKHIYYTICLDIKQIELYFAHIQVS